MSGVLRPAFWRRWSLLDWLAAVGGAINLAVVGLIFAYWLLT